MPNFCAVVGCASRGNRDRNSFYRIPCIPIKGQPEMIALKTERRMKWILALRRKDLTESKLKYGLICDRHFISGRPAATRDIYNPDWVPSQNMGYDTKSESPKCRKQNESKRAIICYVTPSIPEQVQKERTESEIIVQDEDSESRINFTCSTDTPTDQYNKQHVNGDAIICYIKPYIPEQTGENRTKHKMLNQDKDRSSELSLVYSQDKQNNLIKKQDLNGDSIMCYITPNVSQQFQVERTVSGIIDKDEDNEEL